MKMSGFFTKFNAKTDKSSVSYEDFLFANGYEKLWVVGKGAFGSAVLYKKLPEDIRVVIKEINIKAMDVKERQLALNEVNVLARLKHQNIISYRNSFEIDGILMIEMEFAEGGNLAQFLFKKKKPLSEKEILQMFEQMLRAVIYLHEQDVLHRDLKTANIFLTRDGQIKIGDFGISKVMGTVTKIVGAQTTLGTPNYMMFQKVVKSHQCESQNYNEKSDIWSLGCILYEMACRQKTFDSNNLPALVKKITTAQYAQVQGNYSADLKVLIRDMLRKEPDLRPSAEEILQNRVSPMLEKLKAKDKKVKSEELFADSENFLTNEPHQLRSVLYKFDPINYQLDPINGLPARIRIKTLSISSTHSLCVTLENLVYVWGKNDHGQLALGDLRDRIDQPTMAHTLKGNAISKAIAGTGFSIFSTENGIINSCGDRRFIGQGNLEGDISKPKLIDALIKDDISAIACGSEHCVAVGQEGSVFAWGRGAEGRLGTGKQKDELSPVELQIPSMYKVCDVRCGLTNTVFITESGVLLACGDNRWNQLNVARDYGNGLFNRTVLPQNSMVLTPTPIGGGFGNTLRVMDLSLGSGHTMVLREDGHLCGFGRNSEGQLGKGHRQRVKKLTLVKALERKVCVMVQCGENFTVATTSEHELYYWGDRNFDLDISEEEEREPSIYESSNGYTYIKPVIIIRPPQTLDLFPKAKKTKSASNSSSTTRKSSNSTKSLLQNQDLQSIPRVILKLDTTRSISEKPFTFISFGPICCNKSSVFIVVETTAPLPSNGSQAGILDPREESVVPQLQLDNWMTKNTAKTPTKKPQTKTEIMQKFDISETTTNTWLKKELENATFIPKPKTLLGQNQNAKKRLYAKKAPNIRSEFAVLKDQLRVQEEKYRDQQEKVDKLQKQLEIYTPLPEPENKNETCENEAKNDEILKSKICSIT